MDAHPTAVNEEVGAPAAREADMILDDDDALERVRVARSKGGDCTASVADLIDNYEGYHEMARVVAEWASEFSGGGPGGGAALIVDLLCMQIERCFDGRALRAFLRSQQSSGSASWQPPPFYWALMAHPAPARVLKGLVRRDHGNEFLLAFTQDLLTLERSARRGWRVTADADLSRITSNFAIFAQSLVEVVEAYLLDQDREEGDLDPWLGEQEQPGDRQHAARLLCHTENAFVYALAVLNFLARSRGDLAGCRRLAQAVARHVREVKRAPLVADLQLRFSGAGNFPRLQAAALAVRATLADLDRQRETAAQLDPAEVAALDAELARVLAGFHARQTLLFGRGSAQEMRDRARGARAPAAAPAAALGRQLGGKIARGLPGGGKAAPALPLLGGKDCAPACFSADDFPHLSPDGDDEEGAVEPLPVPRDPFSNDDSSDALSDASSDASSEAGGRRSEGGGRSSCGASSLPPASQVGGGAEEWREEYERLHPLVAEEPPCEFLREGPLVSALLSDLVHPRVHLNEASSARYVELLLNLTTLSPYEILQREVALTLSGGAGPDRLIRVPELAVTLERFADVFAPELLRGHWVPMAAQQLPPSPDDEEDDDPERWDTGRGTGAGADAVERSSGFSSDRSSQRSSEGSSRLTSQRSSDVTMGGDGPFAPSYGPTPECSGLGKRWLPPPPAWQQDTADEFLGSSASFAPPCMHEDRLEPAVSASRLFATNEPQFMMAAPPRQHGSGDSRLSSAEPSCEYDSNAAAGSRLESSLDRGTTEPIDNRTESLLDDRVTVPLVNADAEAFYPGDEQRLMKRRCTQPAYAGGGNGDLEDLVERGSPYAASEASDSGTPIDVGSVQLPRLHTKGGTLAQRDSPVAYVPGTGAVPHAHAIAGPHAAVGSHGAVSGVAGSDAALFASEPTGQFFLPQSLGSLVVPSSGVPCATRAALKPPIPTSHNRIEFEPPFEPFFEHSFERRRRPGRGCEGASFSVPPSSTIAGTVERELGSRVGTSVFRDAHLGTVAGLARTGLRRRAMASLRPAFRAVARRVRAYKEAARADLFAILHQVRMYDEAAGPGAPSRLVELLPHTRTLVGAAAALKYLEGHVFVQAGDADPVCAASDVTVFFLKVICQQHPKQVPSVLLLLSRHFGPSDGQPPAAAATTAAQQLARQRVFAFLLWLMKAGWSVAVLNFVRRHMRHVDQALLRRFSEIVLDLCKPLFSVRFAAALVQFVSDVCGSLDLWLEKHAGLRVAVLEAVRVADTAWQGAPVPEDVARLIAGTVASLETPEGGRPRAGSVGSSDCRVGVE